MVSSILANSSGVPEVPLTTIKALWNTWAKGPSILFLLYFFLSRVDTNGNVIRLSAILFSSMLFPLSSIVNGYFCHKATRTDQCYSLIRWHVLQTKCFLPVEHL